VATQKGFASFAVPGFMSTSSLLEELHRVNLIFLSHYLKLLLQTTVAEAIVIAYDSDL